MREIENYYWETAVMIVENKSWKHVLRVRV